MKSVSKIQARAAAFILCAAAMVAFEHTALADDEVADSDDVDDDDDATVSDRTMDDGYADTDPSAVTAFRSDLAPYGNWVEDSRYGTVWVPSSSAVGADFAPYQTAGHWDLAGDGDWLWTSDYEWGYIPFHYGRWVWVSGVGWAWIPGRAYANAWVSWRVGYDGYIGWAPMPPAYYWWNGGVVILATPPMAPYVFCETSHAFDRNVGGHIIREKAAVSTAAAGTHPYAPPNRSYTPASPTLKEAHVPSDKAPHKFSPPQPKSMKLARPPAGMKSAPGHSIGRTDHGGAPTPKRGRTATAPQGAASQGSAQGLAERGRSTSPFVARDAAPAAHRLDSVRTISSEPRMISTEPRAFRGEARTIPSQVRTLSAQPGLVERDRFIGVESGFRSTPAFDRSRTIEAPRSFDAPRGDRSRSFDSPRFQTPRSLDTSRSFDAPRNMNSARSFEAPRGSSFDGPRPSSTFRAPPSSSPSTFQSPRSAPTFRSSPTPSAAPSPPRRSAPAPSFHPSGGGGGGHFGGGRHR